PFSANKVADSIPPGPPPTIQASYRSLRLWPGSRNILTLRQSAQGHYIEKEPRISSHRAYGARVHYLNQAGNLLMAQRCNRLKKMQYSKNIDVDRKNAQRKFDMRRCRRINLQDIPL